MTVAVAPTPAEMRSLPTWSAADRPGTSFESLLRPVIIIHKLLTEVTGPGLTEINISYLHGVGIRAQRYRG